MATRLRAAALAPVALCVLFALSGASASSCSEEIKTTDGLILIDIQNSFMEAVNLTTNSTPAAYEIPADQVTNQAVKPGAVAVTGSASIVDPVNKWVEAFNAKGAPVFVSIDFHTPDHCSFCRNGTSTSNPGGHRPAGGFCERIGASNTRFDATGRCQDAVAIRAFANNNLNQWPDHCVADDFGARLTPFLSLPDNATFVKKGFMSHLDSYSAFGGHLSTAWPSWNVTEAGPLLRDRPSLSAVLASHGITRLFVMGLATDFCVKMTAIDAINEAFGPVVVVSSASRGVTPAGVDAAITDLQSRGVWVTTPRAISVADVMAEVNTACENENNSGGGDDGGDDGGSTDTSNSSKESVLTALTAVFACATVALAIYAFLLVRARQRRVTLNDGHL